MHIRSALIAAAAAWTMAIVGAQQAPAPPAPQTPAPQTPQPQPPTGGAGRGQGRGGRPPVFPAQQRPPGDPALIERGKTLYSVTCSACHGVDLRGGQLGGPNLLRSQLILNDQQGELILPVVKGSRAEKGMPPLPLSEDDVKAVAEYIHSVLGSSRGQGAPPGGDAPPPDPVIGDANAGQAYFATKCASCHSPTADLQGIATRIPDARALQNLWVAGGGGRGGRGGRGAADGPPPTMATIALASGEKVEGELVRIDDFLVTIKQSDGSVRSVRRDGDVPKIDIKDPLEPHRSLWAVYTDKDMHDVTAYLVTLK